MSLIAKSSLAAVVAAGVLGGAGAGSAAADATPIVPALDAPTPVAGYDGVAMWSQLDKATGKYALVQSVDGGAPTVVPVPEREGPFDVDLGSNRGGNVYAVYTRDGDIYRLRVRTGVETKLTKLSAPGVEERDPTIERGDIAFIRRAGGFDQLRFGNSTRGFQGSKLLVKARSLDGAELGISQAAYVVRNAKGTRQDVHVRNIRTGRDHVVYRAKSGGANFAHITRPSFTDDLKSFVWARTNLGSGTGNRVVKYTLRTGKLSYAVGSSRYSSLGWVSDTVGAVASTALEPGDFNPNACQDAGTNYCSVQLTGPLSFTAKR